MINGSILNIDRDKIDSINKGYFKELRKNPNDINIINNIIKVNIPMIIYIINEYGIKESNPLYDDFLAEGMVILNNSIHKFKYRKGKFSTFVFILLRLKFRRLFSKYSNVVRIPERVRLKLNKLEKDIFTGNKTELTEEEIELINNKVKFFYEFDFDEHPEHRNRDIFFNIDEYKCQLQDLDKDMVNNDWNEILMKVIEKLDKREQKVIKGYFGINSKEYNYSELSKQLNISRQMVTNICNKAIRKLRVTNC